LRKPDPDRLRQPQARSWRRVLEERQYTGGGGYKLTSWEIYPELTWLPVKC